MGTFCYSQGNCCQVRSRFTCEAGLTMLGLGSGDNGIGPPPCIDAHFHSSLKGEMVEADHY
jgi:hypothetical protein